jgi:hypothetical protein
MEFSVNSNALVGLSDLMDRRWEDFESARAYLKANARFSAVNAGVLNDICGQHQKIVDGIDTFLSAAAQGFAGPCATAVTEANLTYRRSDREAVIRGDAALPRVRTEPAEIMGPVAGVPSGLADLSADRSVFGDATCPTTWLQPPPDHHADYPYEFTFFDRLSPSEQVRNKVWQITSAAAQLGLIPRPVDILMDAVTPLSGDWASYLGCADVYDNLAHLIEDAAQCVDVGRWTIGRVWTGNAADACVQAIAAFSVNVRAAIDPLRQTASAYRSVADVVRAEARFIEALLATIIDLLVEDALEIPTAGLELPLELATGFSNAVKIVRLAAEVISLTQKARTGAIGRMALPSGPMDAVIQDLVVSTTVWDLNPAPAMAATAPNLPRPGSNRFQ